MKISKIIGALALLFIGGAYAQPTNPVQWKVTSVQTEGAVYEVIFEAQIGSSWHLYDLGPYGQYGPNATTFTLNNSDEYKLVGAPYEKTKPTEKFDPTFEMQIGYYSDRAVFAQKIKLNATSAKVTGTIDWMVCDDKSCLPPADKDFSVVVGNPNSVVAQKTGAKSTGANDGAVTTTAGAGAGAANSANDQKTASKTAANNVVVGGGVVAGNDVVGEGNVVAVSDAAIVTPAQNIDSAAMLTPAQTTTEIATTTETSTKSLWATIIEAILWGFAALLTPCVFPMVPMTVSFFMKNEAGAARGRFMAMMYGIFIVGLYTIPIAAIILITRVIGGDVVTADIFNWLATHWIPNVLFFLVFMVFAASFFGAFEITMPSWMVNRSDTKASKGGLGGLFFMALTLVLVSFSCTGPIVGSVLIKSTAGEFWEPIITMLAFSAAFALPFIIFAMFPSLLKGLPRSGGWLNSVKVVLGFIEVALGLKFLSVADQTYHWGILDREIYLAIWIVVFSLLGVYLLGKLKFANDSDVKHVTVTRLFLSMAVFSFVIYLVPGMFGAPLKGLSGYLPPMHTQDFALSSGGANNSSTTTNGGMVSDKPTIKYSEFLSLPHDLEGFFNYEQAAEYARKVGKPLFVDFTGHGCVNCREMEARVWSNPEVLKLLRNEYVIVALYSDDKKELAQEDWITTENGKVLKSLGKINSYFAHKRFGVNAQPYYMILNDKGEQIVPARGYDLNVAAFIDFLEKGVKAYNKPNE